MSSASQPVQSTELPLRYNEGAPLSYRFNASTGVLNINGSSNVTTNGEQFSIAPLAFRHFYGEFFGQPKKEWVELFFLNEDGALCVVQFHGFSVDNFVKCVKEKLYYEKGNLGVTDVEWTFKLVPKTNKKSGSTFYIADFAYRKLKPQVIESHQIVRDSVDYIYSEKTVKGTEQVFTSYAYRAKEKQDTLPQGEAKALPTGETAKE